MNSQGTKSDKREGGRRLSENLTVLHGYSMVIPMASRALLLQITDKDGKRETRCCNRRRLVHITKNLRPSTDSLIMGAAINKAAEGRGMPTDSGRQRRDASSREEGEESNAFSARRFCITIYKCEFAQSANRPLCTKMRK